MNLYYTTPARTVFVTVLLTLLCFKLSAQRNYVTGFVMTTNGEQKWGYVSYDDLIKGRQVYFKNSRNDTAVEKYDVNTLKGFIKVTGTDTVIYEKAIVKYREIKSVLNGTDQVLVNDSFNVVTDTLFLQLIVGGKFSLFYMQGMRSCFFYRMKGTNEFNELNFRTYLKPQHKSGDNMHSNYRRSDINYLEYITVPEYKVQLVVMMAGCDALPEKISKARYNLKDLKELAVAYNNCGSNGASYYVKKGETVTATLLVAAGFCTTWLDIKGNYRDLGDTKFRAGIGYAANIGVKINLNELSPRLGLRIETGVKGYKTQGTYNYYYTSYNNYKATTTFNLLYVKGALIPELTLGNMQSHFKPYINLGFTSGYLIKTFTNNQHKEGKVLTPVNTNTAALDALKKYELGFVFSTGVRLYRYAGVELRYEFGNGITQSKALSSYTNSLIVSACFFY